MTLLSRQRGLVSALSIGAVLTLAHPPAGAQPSADPTSATANPAAPAASQPGSESPSGSESAAAPAPNAQEGDKSAPGDSAATPQEGLNTNTNNTKSSNGAKRLVTPLRVVPVPSTGLPKSGLQWNERWRRVTLLEHISMGIFGVGSLVANELPARNTGRWDNAFDDGIRDALRAESYETRRATATASDMFYYGLMAYPILVDTLFVAGLQNTDVAWQMTVMNLNSLALSGMLSIMLERVFGRERPFVRECAADPGYDPDCDGPGEKINVSFPSGHTIMASTGAGLICAHHLNLPLYGGGWPDVLACGTAITVAGFQGFFRLTADRHYATDVIAFSLVGFGSGFLLPSLLHYKNWINNTDKASLPRVSIVPFASDTGGGLIASGFL